MTTAWDPWNYHTELPETYGEAAINGYKVEATDGSIGKIDEVGTGFVVVDTGPWIFGKKVMLPVGTIAQIDTKDEKVYVGRTKDEIKNAPEFDEDAYKEHNYRDKLGSYYGDYYRGA